MAHNIHLRATTRLPGLDIEVVHRRSPGRDREEFSVNLHAVVGFQPWGFFLELANPFLANPFLLWAEVTKRIWLEAARAMTIPPGAARTLPNLSSNVLPFTRRTD
jgi:hypothetical protein